MNYFELFEIPVQLRVEKKGLAKKYFELSKKFHPDYYINDEPEAQQKALEQSALLNKALKTLQSPDQTIQYVLMQKGLLQEEEKYELPAAFLMDMMDINEAIAESNDAIALKNEISRIENSIYEPVKAIIENYAEGITTTAELLQVKEYYYKKKYLSRLEGQLTGMM